MSRPVLAPASLCAVIAGLAISVSACVIQESGDDDAPPTGTGQGSGSGSGSGTTTHVPRIGEWHYVDVTPISSSCLGIEDGTAGNFWIDMASPAAFRVLPGDGTDPFTCNLAGNAFDCPNRATLVDDKRPQYDAVLTVHATAAGTFTSTTRGSGQQHASVSCTGSACAVYGSWPCTFSVSFQIAAR